MSKRRTNHKRILLVDENVELLNHLAEHCRKIGLQAFTASDAVKAVKLLEEKEPHLICLDMNVPGGNGMRLCEMVLGSPDDVTCPVIVMTDGSGGAEKGLCTKTCAGSTEMCVYHVKKRRNAWKYLEPVIYELVDIQPASRRPNDEERDITEYIS